MKLTDKFLESIGKRNNIIGSGHDTVGWAIVGYDVFKTDDPGTYKLVRVSTNIERLVTTVAEFLQAAYEDGVIEGERTIQNKLTVLLGLNHLENKAAQKVIDMLNEQVKKEQT